ncbi:hypothetical protein ACJ3XI_07435 [Litorimonas sp. RW-G-Af-16]|uniref:hypothetical protein n=1 Tax=Litorimonas sp. RW-G-Af-16 TaxID=3241168 RepID=UPI00390CCF06
MTARFLLLCFAGLSLAACTTTTAPTSAKATAPAAKAVAPSTQTAAADTAADEEDPMICEMVAVTGQIRKKEVCIRKSNRDARKKDGRNSLDGIQRGALSSCIPNAGGACGG